MVSVAVESLASCMACDLALLEYGEAVLDILDQLTITRMSVLADTPDPRCDRLPNASVGLVFGAVRRQSHVQQLRQLRAKVDVLLALGTCAVTGGVAAMAFLPGANLDDALARRVPTVAGPAACADQDLLPGCLPVRHYVRVELEVPGCPPHPDWIAECLLALLDARTPLLPQRSVCDVCPARRSGSAPLDSTPFRMLDTPDPPPHRALADLPCLLEQGFLCMGPVTRAGCGGEANAPRCIHAYAPCRGCHGPAHNSPQPLADYVGVLTAAGYDIRTVPDIPGFLSRFSGMCLHNYSREED